MIFTILALFALVLAFLPACLFLWNLTLYRPLRSTGKSSSAVSVLIPARNEESSIRAAVESVLANRGVAFEIVVLDDHSEDRTAAIVRELAGQDERVRLESAPALPDGWCGKQHACHVLARHARQPLLVFMDADVRLAPDALARMACFMESNRAALASGVPRQLTETFLEKLVIPLIHFVLLGFLPMWRMKRCPKPAYAAGCGQLFIARADAYQRAGGHAAICRSLHDGLTLPRAFRLAGLGTDLFDATDLATCRMYRTGREVLAGLGKNATEGFATPAMILPATLLLLGGQVLPWLLLALSPWHTGSVLFLAGIAAACSLLPRLLAARLFRQSWLGAVLHPLSISIFMALQWVALFGKSWGHSVNWKGRTYAGRIPLALTVPSIELPRSGAADYSR